jgi:hypothetical protein
LVNKAKNDPSRKGMGKNSQQEHKQADFLPAGIKKGFLQRGRNSGKIKREICPKTITLLLFKLMDNHQTCSTPTTLPRQKKSVASNDITN